MKMTFEHDIECNWYHVLIIKGCAHLYNQVIVTVFLIDP